MRFLRFFNNFKTLVKINPKVILTRGFVNAILVSWKVSHPNYVW